MRLLIVSVIFLVTHMPSLSFAQEGRVTGLVKPTIKCYCDPAGRQAPMKIKSKKLKKYLEPGVKVLERSHSKIKLQFPARILSQANDKGCHEGETAKTLTCWIKASYAEGENIHPKGENINNANMGKYDKAQCKDMGGVVGAGNCVKQ